MLRDARVKEPQIHIQLTSYFIHMPTIQEQQRIPKGAAPVCTIVHM